MFLVIRWLVMASEHGILSRYDDKLLVMASEHGTLSRYDDHELFILSIIISLISYKPYAFILAAMRSLKK